MIQRAPLMMFIVPYLLVRVQSQAKIPIGKCSTRENKASSNSMSPGWFVDDTTSNDADVDLFASALSAAENLTEEFSWPHRQLSFQSVYENVSVRRVTLVQSTEPSHANSRVFQDANIYSGFHRSKSSTGG